LAVVGGLLVSQALTLYITPVIYLYLEDFKRRLVHNAPPAAGVTAEVRE
jgi:Cu/Ag efflux pump CusA